MLDKEFGIQEMLVIALGRQQCDEELEFYITGEEKSSIRLKVEIEAISFIHHPVRGPGLGFNKAVSLESSSSHHAYGKSIGFGFV